MSRDVLDAILEHMDSAADRFALAKVDKNMYEASKKWSDVDSILFSGTKVLFGKEGTKYRVDMDNKDDLETLSKILELCPSTRRWYIEQLLTPPIIDWLSKRTKKLQKLFISGENFDTRSPIDLSPLVLTSCQALYILKKFNIQMNTNNRIPNNLIKNLLPASLRRVCLTGITVDGPLLQHLASNLPKLASLDLIGTLSNTANTKPFIEALEKNRTLEELSLAPSMFSFSNKSNNKDLGFTFRNLNVAKLSIYMLLFDEQWFSIQLKDWFSKELQTLVLFGNSSDVNVADNNNGLKILIGPNNPIINAKGMSIGSSKLVTHLVRIPPYLTSIHNRPITPASWKCDIEELIREEEAAVAAAQQLRNRAIRRRGQAVGHILRNPRVPAEERVQIMPEFLAAHHFDQLVPPVVGPQNPVAPVMASQNPVAPVMAPQNPVAPVIAPQNSVAANPDNQEQNLANGLLSTSTVPSASSRSYVLTPFPTNSSISNESISFSGRPSMEIVSSVNPTSPIIRPATPQEAAAVGATGNEPAPIVTEPEEPASIQNVAGNVPIVAGTMPVVASTVPVVAGAMPLVADTMPVVADTMPVVAIEPLATSTPLLTSQTEVNINADASRVESNLIILNQRIPDENWPVNEGGARIREDANAPMGEEDVVSAGEMQEAFEDLLLATMATMLAEIENGENDEDIGEYADNIVEFADNDDEIDPLLTPNDASPTVSPDLRSYTASETSLRVSDANDLHTAIEPTPITTVAATSNGQNSSTGTSAPATLPANGPSTATRQ